MIGDRLEPEKADKGVAASYFWSANCQKCKLIGPSLESIMQRKGVVVTKINVSTEQDIALHYNVLSLPTLIFFRNGREELRLTGGDVTIAKVENAWEAIIKKPP